MLEAIAKALNELISQEITTCDRSEWEEAVQLYVIPILDGELVSYEVLHTADSVTIRILV